MMEVFGKYILLFTLLLTLTEANQGDFSCSVTCNPQCQNNGTYQDGECICPDSYSGTYCERYLGNHVLYWSFDTLENLLLMEGTQQRDFNALTQGKVNSGLSVYGRHRQWVDLGVHTEACITRPDTCGAAGGAISVWVKENECPHSEGILSSQGKIQNGTGFTIWCLTTGHFYYVVGLLDEDFYVYGPSPRTWVHIVFNFTGPDVSQGIRIYNDAEQVGESRVEDAVTHAEGDGKIVFGRFFTDADSDYATAEIDELLFFNHALSAVEIFRLSQIST